MIISWMFFFSLYIYIYIYIYIHANVCPQLQYFGLIFVRMIHGFLSVELTETQYFGVGCAAKIGAEGDKTFDTG